MCQLTCLPGRIKIMPSPFSEWPISDWYLTYLPIMPRLLVILPRILLCKTCWGAFYSYIYYTVVLHWVYRTLHGIVHYKQGLCNRGMKWCGCQLYTLCTTIVFVGILLRKKKTAPKRVGTSIISILIYFWLISYVFGVYRTFTALQVLLSTI